MQQEIPNPQSIVLPAERAPSWSAPVSPEPLDVGTLVDLWLANTAAFGPKWTKRAGELPIDDEGALTIAGGVWARGLAGLARAAVLGALERHARVSAWPAELSELRALCLGVPSLAEVRLILLRDEAKKPPFVRLVFEHLDFYNWRMADQRNADRMLADAYATARDHVLLGGALPLPATGELESPEKRKPSPASPEVAQWHINEIRTTLGVPPPLTGKDAAAGPDA